ncbi:hypothetical protein LOK49_LG02G04013 [Camellia lanceoleosa]|uniref:Uncharacterized protein n=1 Tax=Camellia lanceoleosa TaxID=1840588 RepID=A0ACC0IKZ9_9ERIC|nr:hypothetical protein LOK49_LG02G04013 [Camellia lanceoleosa]
MVSRSASIVLVAFLSAVDRDSFSVDSPSPALILFLRLDRPPLVLIFLLGLYRPPLALILLLRHDRPPLALILLLRLGPPPPALIVNKVVHSKATRLHRVNAQDSVTGGTKENDKVGVNKYNRLGNGKENVTSQRPNTGAGGTVQQVQIVTEQKSIVPKVNKVVHSKATRLHRVNAQDSVTGGAKANDKVGVNKYNRLGNGKENVTSQRPNTELEARFRRFR